jgi:hypothetical protein
VGAMFSHAVSLFFSYPDVFGSVGTEESLIERVVGMDNEASVKEAYARFDTGEWGKVVFRPWN